MPLRRILAVLLEWTRPLSRSSSSSGSSPISSEMSSLHGELVTRMDSPSATGSFPGSSPDLLGNVLLHGESEVSSSTMNGLPSASCSFLRSSRSRNALHGELRYFRPRRPSRISSSCWALDFLTRDRLKDLDQHATARSGSSPCPLRPSLHGESPAVREARAPAADSLSFPRRPMK